EALSAFRDLSHPVGEATALLAVSHAALDADIQGAQSAANQALKLFRELGHLKALKRGLLQVEPLKDLKV
ncbi:tetA, partial [Symbiodinium sp. CCMP2456]